VAQGGRVRPALRQASLDEVLRTVRASRWTSPEAAGLVPAEVHEELYNSQFISANARNKAVYTLENLSGYAVDIIEGMEEHRR
ncbi:MAG: hypothetical protein AB1497_06525, partial [Bacillota bacterium]